MSKMKLGECCLSISDGDHMPPPKSSTGIPFLTISDIDENNHLIFNNTMFVPQEYWDKIDEKRKAHNGDVLLSVTGSYGIPVYIDFEKEFVFQRHIAILKPNTKIISGRYLYYLFKSPTTKRIIDKLVTGAIQKTLGLDMIRNMSFDIPPINEQDSIIDILVHIDALIDNNTAICSDLEAMSRFLYDYWFVQFDFPDENGKPYKSSGGKMVWNEELKREIPEGWKVRPTLEVFDWIGTSQPPKSAFKYVPTNGYIRFIQNRDYDADDYITYIPLTNSTRTCNELDIMMDKYGDAGKTRFGIAGAYNVALSKISVHDENMREYVRAYLKSDTIYNYLHTACIASTRASLNEANFIFLSIVIPDSNTLQKYDEVAKSIITKQLDIKSENRQLASLRDFLLPMLINEQVKVCREEV